MRLPRALSLVLFAAPATLVIGLASPDPARAHDSAEKEPFSVRVRRGDRFFHTTRTTQRLVRREGDAVVSDSTTRTVRDDVAAVRYVDSLGQIAEYLVETPVHRFESVVAVPPADPANPDAEPQRREGTAAFHGAAITYVRREGLYQPLALGGTTPPEMLRTLSQKHAFALDEEYLPVEPLLPEEGWTSRGGKRTAQILAEIEPAGVLSGEYTGQFRTRAVAESDQKPIGVVTSAFRLTTRVPIDAKTSMPMALDVTTEVWFDFEGAYVRRVATTIRGTAEQTVDGKVIRTELAADWSRVITRVDADWKYEGSSAAAVRPESVRPVFDRRPWRLASSVTAPERRAQAFVVDGQTASNWRELVTVRWFGGEPGKLSAAEFAAKMKEESVAAAAGETFELLSDDETGVIFRRTPREDGGPDSHHAIGRVIRGKSGIHTVTYAMKAHHMNSKWADAWIAALKQVEITP